MYRMYGYVQDVRYTAGAGKRRSGAFQFCTAPVDVRYTAGAGKRRSGAFQFCTAPVDERYTAGAGRAGAVPLNFARRLTQGGGESGDRSKRPRFIIFRRLRRLRGLLYEAGLGDAQERCLSVLHGA
jgi:hypothetical protein